MTPCFLLFLLVLIVGCNRGSAATLHADSALKVELLSRVDADQAVRDTFALQMRETGRLTPRLIARMTTVDSGNVAWLRSQVRRSGVPTAAQVGREGMEALWLLVQHADRDTAFQAMMLPLMQSAYAAGEVSGQELAMLTDRVAKARGQRQTYGTQASIHDGVVDVDPIEDSAGVDARRAVMGLMPLAVYKQALDSMYAQSKAARPVPPASSPRTPTQRPD